MVSEYEERNINRNTRCLNPYCSGIWSRSKTGKEYKSYLKPVLILIVVEYGLGGYLQVVMMHIFKVLILIVVEYGLGDS